MRLPKVKNFGLENPEALHTIAYVAPDKFVRHRSITLDTQGPIQTTRFSEDAASYTFTNKRHPDVNDPRYSVFK